MGKRLDLIGKKFNKLKVLKFSHISKRTSFWLCKCDCGKKKRIRGYSLTNGSTKSCGCAKKASSIDKSIIGLKFNCLKIIKFSYAKNGHSYYKCLCDCKKTKIIRGSHVKDGNTKSCGCLSKGEYHYNYNPNREQIKFYKHLRHRCDSLLKSCLKRIGKKKEGHTYDILGYTSKELAENLGITSIEQLKNYEIDHIFPIKAFCDYGISDVKIINSLDNLQLLTPEENNNNNKGCKYDDKKFKKYLKKKGIKI